MLYQLLLISVATVSTLINMELDAKGQRDEPPPPNWVQHLFRLGKKEKVGVGMLI